MIEPTEEMMEALGRDGTRAGLAAVLAIVERDYCVTPRPCQWCGTPPGHHYLSTGCLHDHHAYCQGAEGAVGAKSPAQCKWCAAPCRCACHAQGG